MHSMSLYRCKRTNPYMYVDPHWEARLRIKYLGHMTKMAVLPIYVTESPMNLKVYCNIMDANYTRLI